MKHRLNFILAFSALAIVFITACTGLAAQSGTALRVVRQPVEGGDPEQGRRLIAEYGCGSCHTIPGIPAANTHVGPPLTDWSQRVYIAGSHPNTLENLMVWIMNPQGMEPNTAMPVLGVSEDEARQMSAYLYTLGN